MKKQSAGNRPVVAVSLSMTWGARNLIRSGLIRDMARTMDVVVLFRLPQADLQKTCVEMGARIWILPPEPKFNRFYTGISGWLDRAQKLRGGTASRRFRLERLRRNAGIKQRCGFAVDDLLAAASSFGPVFHLCKQLEPALFDPIGKDEAVQQFLFENEVRLLVLTSPFQGRETRLMHASKRAGVSTVALVLGFDNLSTKKRQPVASDYYFTWNEAMRREVLELFPKTDADDVKVTGSPQFDFYADPNWGRDEEKFREGLGLRLDGPLILYSAGSGKYIPSEHLLAEDLICRLRKTALGQNISVIVRMHPFERNPARWDRIKNLPDVALTTPWESDPREDWGNITDEEIHLLCGSLKHSRCVVNVCSTMSLDAVFCDRPVVAPAYDIGPEPGYSRHVERLYQQEHFLPVANSGAIDIVPGPEAAVEAIHRALINPGRRKEARSALTGLMLGRPIGESSKIICETLLRLAQ